MHNHSLPKLSVHACWLVATISVVVAVVPSACANVAPPTIQGIPALQDVVTVIPFQSFRKKEYVGTIPWPYGNQQEVPWVMIQAEVDGHRGTFSLDTGSPTIFLSSAYLRSTPTGGLDTVMAGKHQEEPVAFVTVHTLRVGTLVQHFGSAVAGMPPQGLRVNPANTIVTGFPEIGVLGNLGLTGLEPFETIVDYVHQRVVFIRLDTAGRRLAAVPAYTPAGTVSLVPASSQQHWGIEVRHGAVIDTVIVDTGSPTTDITEGDQQQAADQLRHAIVTSHDSSNIVNRSMTVHGEKEGMHLFGAQFLSRLGVVGFNLRTHQLILYR